MAKAKANVNVKFPPTLYVKMERDGATVYFVADIDPEGIAEMGETIDFAIYTRKETGAVSMHPDITIRSAK